MFDLERNCVFYNVDDINRIKNSIKINTSLFDKFQIEEDCSDYTKVTYTWIDHIRVRDKIVGREQKTVSFLLLGPSNIICFFLNSESKMVFIIKKLIDISQVSFKKLNLFNIFINGRLDEKKTLFKIINYHVKKPSTTYNENIFWEINNEEIGRSEIRNFYDSNLITNLTLKSNNIYFYLDSQSVVSFNDTDGIKEILDVIVKITGNIN
ncbi:hypothetical protein BAG01nite_30240 [Brevibacillus agri]|uniref:Uncharacterized protein n=1 Tax=Brevibacillus agri TaxID=51101 RepID=A0A3M8B4P0_9BACL|nr:hypothetical protein [Brevibacillus agri]QAV11849.1 hypothetical protein BA6348_03215 [Brevibacillus agri]RNB57795.1 hypothetical protein EB820_06600 [Brevibacillus agri]GED26922.1 hypothetical protein BAG01nite_30240 [Brevibacillus agri]